MPDIRSAALENRTKRARVDGGVTENFHARRACTGASPKDRGSRAAELTPGPRCPRAASLLPPPPPREARSTNSSWHGQPGCPAVPAPAPLRSQRSVPRYPGQPKAWISSQAGAEGGGRAQPSAAPSSCRDVPSLQQLPGESSCSGPVNAPALLPQPIRPLPPHQHPAGVKVL